MFSGMDLELVKRVGVNAAIQSAEIIRNSLGNITAVSKKGAIDLVTEADTGSEKIIIETIRSKFPDHAILAEESGLNKGTSACKWVIDPLDGTTNFAHQLNHFSISIAFSLDEKVVTGVVLNPLTGELFSAIQGNGAELNGRSIRVSDEDKISDSLLVTGFPYNLKEIFDTLILRFSSCLKAARGVRRLGSAALDLCYVACGRFDGFWEQNLKPWDTAAGMLIAQEAGAAITDFKNKPFSIDKDEILATNGKIHNKMISLLEIKETV